MASYGTEYTETLCIPRITAIYRCYRQAPTAAELEKARAVVMAEGLE